MYPLTLHVTVGHEGLPDSLGKIMGILKGKMHSTVVYKSIIFIIYEVLLLMMIKFFYTKTANKFQI